MIMQFEFWSDVDDYIEKTGVAFQDGDSIYISSEDKRYIYYQGWKEYEIEDIKITLYEINKQLMANEKPHGEEELKDDIQKLSAFNDTINSQYYMLLCSELHYYTFLMKENNSNAIFANEVLDCLKALGDILSIETTDQNVVEIWIRTSDEEIHCLYLFDYSQGIVYFK